MVRKKKTPKKDSTQSFFSKKQKKRKSKDSPSFVTGLKIALTILFLTALAGGGAIGLLYLDRYVKVVAEYEVPEGTVVFKTPPIWLNQEWKEWIESVLGSTTFPLDAHSAQLISEKLKPVTWFKDFTVQTKPDCITVDASYRRPVGIIGSGNSKMYVGDDMAIMNYIPLTAIPVIEIRGTTSKIPEPGQIWLAEDAEAAVNLLNLLYRIDQLYQQEMEKKKDNKTTLPGNKIPEKPLLDEIESIDVSNFAGRKSSSPDKPHIILNAKDGTKVYWGAAWGQATVHFEADEEAKIARLYQFFMDHNNTLQGAAKYIDLRWLQDNIPRPR